MTAKYLLLLISGLCHFQIFSAESAVESPHELNQESLKVDVIMGELINVSDYLSRGEIDWKIYKQDCMKESKEGIEAGDPVGVLTQDGTLYVLLRNKNGTQLDRKRLMRLAGKHVNVIGTLYKSADCNGLMVVEVEEAGRC